MGERLCVCWVLCKNFVIVSINKLMFSFLYLMISVLFKIKLQNIETKY